MTFTLVTALSPEVCNTALQGPRIRGRDGEVLRLSRRGRAG